MFVFVKLIKPFFLPPTLIALGILVSIIFLWRGRQRWAQRLLIIIFVFYYALSIQPVSNLLVWSLEKDFIRGDLNLVDAKDMGAIVILAGGASKKDDRIPFAELSGASWKRLWRGIELYKKFDGQIPIIYSGGSGDPFDPISEEAELSKDYAKVIGIPEAKFLIDSVSRDTYESGVEIKRLLDKQFFGSERRIILVTSAYHMPRAVAVMNGLNISVVACPADFLSIRWRLTPLSFFPSVSSLSSSVVSIHEWVGIIGYKILGRL